MNYCTDISSMTMFAEANVDVDLRMLRSFRVLRPLKLVSRIPSKLAEVPIFAADSNDQFRLDTYTQPTSIQ